MTVVLCGWCLYVSVCPVAGTCMTVLLCGWGVCMCVCVTALLCGGVHVWQCLYDSTCSGGGALCGSACSVMDILTVVLCGGVCVLWEVCSSACSLLHVFMTALLCCWVHVW